jgi:transposase
MEAAMRGQFSDQGRMFSYLSPEERVPQGHPLRAVRAMVRAVLEDLHGDFSRLYSSAGRPSIPPEQLLSALLLQVFYGIRSERQLMEQLDYNLLYRWFVGLDADAAVWVPTTFTKNRERLQQGDIFQRFMTILLHHPKVKPLLSDEHFSVDGTLIEAWASHRSFQPKDGSGGDGTDFHKQKRSNQTHASVTDPESRLYKKAKGKESKLCYMGHALMENRNGLVVGGRVTHATGTAEREASEAMLAARVKQTGKPATVGEDKAYDAAEHGAALRKLKVTPHVARSDALTKTGKRRTSIVSDKVAASAGYAMSQTRRKLIECVFGWGKQHGTLRKTKHRGIAQVTSDFLLNIIAYNLIRIPKLIYT